MRVALAGKGGVGKTTIAATLARLIGQRGQQVLAVDGDSNPNLAAALGISTDGVGAAVLPSGLVSRRQTGPALVDSVEAILDRHALVGPDGVRVVLMGMPAHAEEGCLCSAHATVSALLDDLGGRPDTTVVIDMEASPEHLSRGTTRHVDLLLLLVSEPYYRSLETVRRLAQLAAELPIPRVGVVANKVRRGDDLAAITEFCRRHDLDLLGAVPHHDDVVDVDIRGVPLLDAAPPGGPWQSIPTANVDSGSVHEGVPRLDRSEPGLDAVVAAIVSLADLVMDRMDAGAARETSR